MPGPGLSLFPLLKEGYLKRLHFTGPISAEPVPKGKTWTLLYGFVTHVTGTVTNLYIAETDPRLLVTTLVSAALATASEKFDVPRGFLGNATSMVNFGFMPLTDKMELDFDGAATAEAVIYVWEAKA